MSMWPDTGAQPDHYDPFSFRFPTIVDAMVWLGEERRSHPVPPRRSRQSDGNDGTASQAAELILYVSPASVACARAEGTLQALLRQHDVRIRFRVVDVARNIKAAERDRVLFTPTLICRTPKGDTRLLGDLSNIAVLIELLQTLGTEPI